jgi:hypothetical protein
MSNHRRIGGQRRSVSPDRDEPGGDRLAVFEAEREEEPCVPRRGGQGFTARRRSNVPAPKAANAW